MSEEKQKPIIDCVEAGELLVAYLDNELNAEERIKVEGHLSGCPRCKKELEALRSAQKMLRHTLETRAAEVNPSPESWSQFQLGLEVQRPSFLFLFRRRKWRIIGTIILAAIIIALAILWGVGIFPGIR